MIGADIEEWKLKLAKDMGTDVVINTNTKDKTVKDVSQQFCRYRNIVHFHYLFMLINMMKNIIGK